MKFAVIRFPGSNCDTDCIHALRLLPGVTAELVWHKESDLSAYDAIVLPGGFSYGDYLRCGAIARFSPVMQAVKQAAEDGKLVIGICNGFQILCESRLLPGALVRNRDLHFICETVSVRIDSNYTPLTNLGLTGSVLQIPIAHGEGCYMADDETLRELNVNRQILFRYCDNAGITSEAANPNGSKENIAGICNLTQNVFGLMPHPERASETRLGSSDGMLLFRSLLEWHRLNKISKS
ncbi:MAG: phosphoribosylformylglycinamidine synthase subunit PurQ [Chthoniobacterales bacterium]